MVCLAACIYRNWNHLVYASKPSKPYKYYYINIQKERSGIAKPQEHSLHSLCLQQRIQCTATTIMTDQAHCMDLIKALSLGSGVLKSFYVFDKPYASTGPETVQAGCRASEKEVYTSHVKTAVIYLQTPSVHITCAHAPNRVFKVSHVAVLMTAHYKFDQLQAVCHDILPFCAWIALALEVGNRRWVKEIKEMEAISFTPLTRSSSKGLARSLWRLTLECDGAAI